MNVVEVLTDECVEVWKYYQTLRIKIGKSKSQHFVAC